MAQNTTDMAVFNGEQTAQDNRLDLLENYNTGNTGDISALQACCLTQTTKNDDQDDRLDILENQVNVSNTPTIAAHTIQINTLTTDFNNYTAANDAAVTDTVGKTETNRLDIVTNAQCCTNQQVQIDALLIAGSITDAEIADAVDRNPGTQTLKDADQTKLNNLPANQIAINLGFTNDIAIALRDAWDIGVTYEMGDIVSFNNLLYISTAAGNIAQNPGAGLAWTLPAAQGPQYKDFTATAGFTDFTIAGAVFSTAYVYVNGVKIRDTQYSLSNNGINTTLSLVNPAVANQWISVEY